MFSRRNWNHYTNTVSLKSLGGGLSMTIGINCIQVFFYFLKKYKISYLKLQKHVHKPNAHRASNGEKIQKC